MPPLSPVHLPDAARHPGGASPGRPHGDRAFSACAFVSGEGRLTASPRVQLLPAGEFRSLDGRPTEVRAWFIDADIAADLIAAAAARETPYVLDYHHQSLIAAEKGITAPAAGWFKALEWVDGVGLFATDVQWTEMARAMVEADELRYVSPVFVWDPASGKVTDLINAALTNTPGLDGMAAVAERIAALAAGLVYSLEPTMDDLLERLRYFLNLPITATAEACAAELHKLIEQLGPPPSEVAAASLPLSGRLQAALSAAAAPPDPALYVPMAVHLGLQAELSTARATIEVGQRDALMQAALADGRILSATEGYWRGQPLAALTAYLEQAKPIAALTGMQSARLPAARAAAGAFIAPTGYDIDGDRLALHRQALAYASEHRCSYAQAVAAVQS